MTVINAQVLPFARSLLFADRTSAFLSLVHGFVVVYGHSIGPEQPIFPVFDLFTAFAVISTDLRTTGATEEELYW
jgi:hypothetical protein